MANEATTCLLFLSFLIFFCSGTNAFSTFSGARFLQKSKISKSQIQFLVTDHKIWRKLENTNPASTPDSPTIITVPSTNPVTTVSPTNPGATPVTVPSTTPPPVPLSPTNPANSPVPVTNPVTPPITVPGGTQPVNSYPPPSPVSGGTGTVPVTNPPPSSTSPPSSQGGSWCVAKPGTPQSTLQTALDYACGTKGADCSQINQGGSCYNPNSLQNHASFAFNSYYVKNPAATSCDFGGVATIVNTNPSSGTCIFPSSSGGAGAGAGAGAGTSGGSGTTSSPVGFGPQSSPLDSSHSTCLRPLLSCMVLVTLLVSGRLGMSP